MNIGKSWGVKQYTPGSLYKRSKQIGLIDPGSKMKKANRQTIEKLRGDISNSGSTMFNAIAEQSQGKSELVTQQLMLRVQEQAKAKIAETTSLGEAIDKVA